MIAVRANITNLRNQLRQLSTGHQIARRHGNPRYSLVNKSPLNLVLPIAVVPSSTPTCSIASAKRVQPTSDTHRQQQNPHSV
jgi:hypothetical protein